MIRLNRVTKRYRTQHGHKTVLDDVSLDFPVGASVGILGLNGAGKTTLIRIIGGAEPPDSGRVECNQRISWPLGYSGGFQGTLTARARTPASWRASTARARATWRPSPRSSASSASTSTSR